MSAHIQNAASTLQQLLAAREPQHVVTCRVRPDRADTHSPPTSTGGETRPVSKHPDPTTDGRVPALSGLPNDDGGKQAA